MDDTALINDDDALHRIVRLLARRGGERGGCGGQGYLSLRPRRREREPARPWAIKVANSTIQSSHDDESLA